MKKETDLSVIFEKTYGGKPSATELEQFKKYRNEREYVKAHSFILPSSGEDKVGFFEKK